MAKYVLAINKDIKTLSRRSEEIDVYGDRVRLTKLINDLKDTLRANKNLVALAAPQLNQFERVFCIDFNNDIRTFINPVITKLEGFTFVRESNPSIPNKEFIVPRSTTIYAIYQKADGTPESNKFEGRAAEIFQHQVDLLDGVLISDFGLEILPEFDAATEEERIELLNKYRQFLKRKQTKLDKEIEEDEDLKKIRDAAKFITAVAKGEVDIEKLDKK